MPFPVVGIGASAGGIEAVTSLMRALPADTGMAFVLVQHLDPTHESMLTEILSRATAMPTAEVHARMAVQPNHVYVIAPAVDLILSGGELHPSSRTEARKRHQSIDVFLRSLAQDQGHQAIGVILSGSASDGTLGLGEIKAAGGITFAQDDTAQHDSMPRSAVAAGSVDFVLSPAGIAGELTRIARHPYVAPAVLEAPALLPHFGIAPVLELLHESTGVDFTHYKRNTLYRRITRRMVLHKVGELDEYVPFLKANPAEVEALYQDMLINVTSFFRNPESYEALKQDVFPRLVEGRSRQDPVRMWVLGCSTGEEVYSLAIAFSEFQEASGRQSPFQIFATDLNGQVIEKARTGVYSRNIVQDLSAERLRRYFVESEGTYQIRKSIRDACVFARHNVLTEPPFSRIDFVSCRNLLIYLGHEIQQRVISVLHYALQPAGLLWLGNSETIGSYGDLFDLQNSRHKIYRKKRAAQRLMLSAPASGFPPKLKPEERARSREAPLPGNDVQKEADRVLLARYAPASVLVNSDLDILQFRGNTGFYLAPAPGRASLNLLKMLRDGLLVPVRAALHRARKDESAARQEALRVKSNGGYHDINVEVIPVRCDTGESGCFLVLFEEADRAGGAAPMQSDARQPRSKSAKHRHAPAKLAERGPADGELDRLKQELAATREYLQSVIAQQEASNEELQSANEEIQSTNEELQSINEELETSKEEIQSSNEELATVNEELQQRNTEVVLTNNDLLNLLSSVHMAIVILGPNLRIRRFTPAAEKMLNLISADVGRSIKDLNLNIALPDLERHLEEVIDTVTVREFEVLDRQGKWHSVRLRPYRTLDNRIDGVVIILVDIDTLKRGEELLQRQADLLDHVNQPILMWELRGNVIYWNRAAESIYGFTRDSAMRTSREALLTAEPIDEIEHVLKSEGHWTGDILHTREDGRRITLNSRMVLVHTEDGREVVIEANRPVSSESQ